MDLNSAHYNMVHQQVRPWDVSHPKILELLLELPRERFVPAKYRYLAFSDTFIPIDFEQVMLTPKIVGRLLQALNLDSRSTVLEIGTGTGYVTALLSYLVRKVISIEIVPELSFIADKNLYSLGIHNVGLEVGDASSGWPKGGPYDAIIFTGSLPIIPEGLYEQLSRKGKVFAILGTEPVMRATSLHRISAGWQEQSLFETLVPPLLNVVETKGFQF